MHHLHRSPDRPLRLLSQDGAVVKGQKAFILRLLRERGSRGISVHELVYEHGITRAAAAIHELRKESGIEIETLDEGDGKLARYILKEAIRPPVPVCVCGTNKRGHIAGEFRCMETGCECERFRAA